MNTATLTNVDTETAEAPAREFSWHDRCDRCGFQAYFVAALGTLELTFCKHHGEKAAPGLVAQGFTVLDFTHMLDQPLVSANVDI